MPDFGAIASLLGNVKSVFDFVGGVTGSLGGFEGDVVEPFEELLGSSAVAE